METLNITIQTERITTPPLLFQRKDDTAVYGGQVRGNAPCPAVWRVSDTQMQITKQWQYYLIAINPGMSLQYISHLLNNSTGFCNEHGFPADPGEQPRANYIKNEDLDYENPSFSAVYTCSFSAHTGRVTTNSAGVKIFIPDTMDGTALPRLKPGYTYPERIQDIQPEAYLYLPKTHRHLFVICNNVTLGGRVFPFANGARYSWAGDDRIYTFIPFVSTVQCRDLLSNWVMLAPGSAYPSAYSL